MKILCLGDSLTDCNRLFSEDPLGDGYVSMLNSSPENQEERFLYINRGVDGFTVSRLLDNARTQYIALRPDCITILIGINDIALMMNTNRTDSQKQELMWSFFEKYDQLLKTLRFATRRIILMEPFLFPYPAEFACWEPYRQTMSDGILSLAEKYHLSYVPLQKVFTDASSSDNFQDITSDGVHLTSKGHHILTEQLKPFFYHTCL